jgi:hypothetical protein
MLFQTDASRTPNNSAIMRLSQPLRHSKPDAKISCAASGLFTKTFGIWQKIIWHHLAARNVNQFFYYRPFRSRAPNTPTHNGGFADPEPARKLGINDAVGFHPFGQFHARCGASNAPCRQS